MTNLRNNNGIKHKKYNRYNRLKGEWFLRLSPHMWSILKPQKGLPAGTKLKGYGWVSPNLENLPLRRAKTGKKYNVILKGNLLDPGPLVNYCS